MEKESSAYMAPSIKVIEVLSKSIICSSTESPAGNASIQDYEEDTLNW